MSELSCDTPFIGQIGALDLVRNHYEYMYTCKRMRKTPSSSEGYTKIRIFSRELHEDTVSRFVSGYGVAVSMT